MKKKYGTWIGEALLKFKDDNRIKDVRITRLEKALREIVARYDAFTDYDEVHSQYVSGVGYCADIARTALKEIDQ